MNRDEAHPTARTDPFYGRDTTVAAANGSVVVTTIEAVSVAPK